MPLKDAITTTTRVAHAVPAVDGEAVTVGTDGLRRFLRPAAAAAAALALVGMLFHSSPPPTARRMEYFLGQIGDSHRRLGRECEQRLRA